MAIPQADRIAFSLQIVSANTLVAALQTAKTQLQVEVNKVQALDTANKNLFDSPNNLVNAYQTELSKLDGTVRSTFTESDIQNSGYKRFGNYFFPNDISTVVPSLSAFHNIWPRIPPFALTFAIGKTYVETYPGSTATETSVTTPLQALIASVAAYADIERTSGQICGSTTGTCSLPLYTDQPTCVLNGGVWSPGPDAITTYAAVQTLKSNIVTAVGTYKSYIQAELALVPTTDTNPARAAQNTAARASINTAITACNTWLALADFQTVPGTVITCLQFYAYNVNLLGPTKLHSTNLATLNTAISTRASYISTRSGQIVTNLGSISQDLNTGALNSSSGLYGQRYSFLLLRLDSLGGSLSKLAGLQTATAAQDSIIANILSTKATYLSIIPTSPLKAPANGTEVISLVTPSLFDVGDSVYVFAEGQEELKRAIKSISGDNITLNDVVPSKYRNDSGARIYKDLT